MDKNGEEELVLRVKQELADSISSDLSDYTIELKQEDQTISDEVEEILCMMGPEPHEETTQPTESGGGVNRLYSFFTKSDEYKAAPSRTNTYVICDLCNKNVKTQKGSTSNLYVHLRKQHPSQYNSLNLTERPQADSRSTYSEQIYQPNTRRRTQYASNTIEQRTRTRAVTELLCTGVVPINLVSHPKFLKLVYLLDPRYEMPSRNDFQSQEIPTLYNEVKNSILSDLTQADSFSLTFGAWTADTTSEHLCLIVHYITDDGGGTWTLQSKCLTSVFLPKDHRGVNIANLVKEVLSEFGLSEDNLQSVTTNTGIKRNGALKNLSAKPLSCIGHVLQEAVTNSLKAEPRVSETLTLCRKIISALSFSNKKKLVFASIQQSLSQNFKNEETSTAPLTLQADVSTEWGSTFSMAKSIYENRSSLKQLFSHEDFKDHCHLTPTQSDENVLENLCQVLEPFHKLTEILNGEKSVTISSVVPLIDHINECCKEVTGEKDLVVKMKERIQNYVNERYCENVDMKLLRQLAYLDPQYRDQVDLSEQEIADLRLQILATCQKTNNSKSIVDCIETEPAPCAPKKSLYSVLVKTTKTDQSSTHARKSTHEEKLIHELSVYRTMPLDPVDPLVFWSSRQVQFPIMSKFIRRKFCMCASGCASDRLFPLSANIVNMKGSSTKLELLNMLAFLAYNLSQTHAC